MLHLPVVSFLALPLDLMMPVFRRGFVGFFLESFPLFLCDSQSQTHYLSSIVSLDTFAHAHTPELPASSKSLERFITPSITDLVRLQ